MINKKLIVLFLIFLLHINIIFSKIITQSFPDSVKVYINMKDEYLSFDDSIFVKHIFINIPNSAKYYINTNSNGFFENKNILISKKANRDYEFKEVYRGNQKQLDIILYPFIKKNNKFYEKENYDIKIVFDKTMQLSKRENKFAINKNFLSKTDLEEINITIKNYLKIRIDSTGIYKISYDDIKQTGLAPENINPNKMVLYTPDTIRYITNNVDFNFSPIEVPYRFIGDNDNVFEKGEYFVFFGQSLWGNNKNIYELSNSPIDMYNNPYSDYNVYILVFNKEKQKKFQAPEFTFKNGVDSVLITKSFVYDSINVLENGYCWVWKDFFFIPDDSDKEFNYDFSLENICSKNGKINIEMFFGINKTYNNELIVNDSFINTFSYFGISSKEPIAFEYELSNLSENNSIKLIMKSNNDYRRCQIKGFSIDYYAKLKDIDNAISFYSDSIIHYTNENEKNIYIYYKKNGNEFLGIIDKKEISINTKNSFVCLDNDLNSPISMEYVDINNTLNKKDADIIVITGNGMRKTLERYKKYREGQGKRVEIYEINEIYNAFTYGFENPSAIRLFLKYTMHNWNNKPEYVFLAGNGTYDYKSRINSLENRNIVPVFETGYIASYESFITPDVTNVSDEWFAWLIGDDKIPDIIPGRVTILNNKELDNVIQKIIDYETKHSAYSQNKCLLIADDEYSSRTSETYSDIGFINQIQNLSFALTGMYVSDYIYVSDYWGDKQTSEHWDADPGEKRQIRFVISDKLNEDFGFMFFLGHGADYTLTHEHILKYPDDIDLFSNLYKYPIVLLGTCSAGEFDRNQDCIASAFQKLRNSGFSASIASSRATTISGNYDILANTFAYYLKEGQFSTIGEYYNMIMAENSGESYVLFGDPAMIVKKRIKDISITRPDTFYYSAMDSIIFNTQNIHNTDLYVNVYQTVYQDSHDYTHVEPYEYVFYPKYDGMFLNTSIPINNSDSIKLNITFPDTMEEKKYINRFIISAISEDDTSYHIAYENYNYIFYGNNNNQNDSTYSKISLFINNNEIYDSIYTDTFYNLKIIAKDISGIYSGNNKEYLSYIDFNDSIIYLYDFIFNESDSTYTKSIKLESSKNIDSIKVKVFNNELNSTEKSIIVKHSTLSESMKDIIVYPNPFNEKIYISFVSSKNGKIIVSLLNSLGGVLAKQEYIFNSGQNILFMDLSKSLLNREILPGIYKLKIEYRYANYRTEKTIYKTLIKVDK